MIRPIHREVRIGHVHLRVSNLERALKFYRDTSHEILFPGELDSKQTGTKKPLPLLARGVGAVPLD